MSGHAVRQQFMKRFRNLDAHGWPVSALIVAATLMQLLAAMALGYWLLQLPLSPLTGLALALVMFFIGTRFRAFNNIVHECSHFAFTRERRHNVLFGSVCAALVLGSFRDYRDEHLTHHAHLGDYDKDLDLQGIRDFRLEEPLTPRTVLRHAMTPILGLHLPYYLSINLSARDGEAFRALKLGLIAAAVLALALAPLPALLLLWLPFLWVYSAINYWIDCIDHGGLVGAEDELEASRNMLLPKPLRLLLFPRNDCYHLIHHLFPQVPVHHFDRCHRELLANPDYRARAEAETPPGRRPASPSEGRAVETGMRA